MRVVTTRPELDSLLRASPHCILVPTMGALHEGHASLIHAAAQLADRRGFPGGCIVSIFVNPTQFNEQADFARYPRTLEADTALCAANGASSVFAPTPETMYPHADRIGVPPLPAQATAPGLEDAHRPGHFAGVCQVVLRLFQLIRPRAAIFGEKDWQQLQVIHAMTREQNLPIDIVGAATIRDPDGLAMSSRNRFLSPGDRSRGLSIIAALRAACAQPTPALAEHSMMSILAAAGITPDYAVVRDASTLSAMTTGQPGRALIAGRVGSVRLIDNCDWPGGPSHPPGLRPATP